MGFYLNKVNLCIIHKYSIFKVLQWNFQLDFKVMDFCF